MKFIQQSENLKGIDNIRIDLREIWWKLWNELIWLRIGTSERLL
jgi:hypothetical protein